jgi:hypothetical protein
MLGLLTALQLWLQQPRSNCTVVHCEMLGAGCACLVCCTCLQANNAQQGAQALCVCMMCAGL